uniref:F-box domain-containing protein n=1 Tax=Lepeophtheirus salmonis TaxID=72036 RepID=A0A0K2U3M9_LEPSM
MSTTNLKRQLSWKNLLPRRKKSIGSSEDEEEEDDNISIGSTTSAFPSFEGRHFSKWKNKWKTHKEKRSQLRNGNNSTNNNDRDGDNVSISSTTSAYTTSKFPTPAWTTKFYANKFLKKRGFSKTLNRGTSEESLPQYGNEDLPPYPKSATIKSNKMSDIFPAIKSSPSLYSMTAEESSVVIHASPNIIKIPPSRKEIAVCWEPLQKRERLSKKRNILSDIWRSKSSTRKINGKILEYLNLCHFNVCRLVCKDWKDIFDCYYPRKLNREWARYLTEAENQSRRASISSYDESKNPFFY